MPLLESWRSLDHFSRGDALRSGSALANVCGKKIRALKVRNKGSNEHVELCRSFRAGGVSTIFQGRRASPRLSACPWNVCGKKVRALKVRNKGSNSPGVTLF